MALPPSTLPLGAGVAAAAPDLAEVEQFLYREARLLDERQFEAWRDLFTEDGIYWAPTQHDQASPDDAVSLFLDDRITMAARIRRLNHPDVHVQTPISCTTHLVTNIEIDPALVDSDVRVFAAFMMAEYRQIEPRWFAGRYEYRLRRTSGQLRIALKKVVLVNCSAPHGAMAIYI
jgi:benzoate/toluate 1,2-dioxygenase beta subunit